MTRLSMSDWLVSNGCVAFALCSRDGCVDGRTLSRKAPRLSRMDALGARSEMNTPLRDNWGGFSRKGVLCRLRYQPFKKYTMFFFLYLPSLLNFRLFYLKVTLSSLHLQPSKLETSPLKMTFQERQDIIRRDNILGPVA